MNDVARSVSQLAPDQEATQPMRQAPLIQSAPIVEPPPMQPPPAKQPRIPRKTLMIIIGIFVVMCVVVGILYTRLTSTQSEGSTPTPTSTIVVTPTPLQRLSAISSTSAFRAYHEAVASFSATLTSFDMQDGGLTPPQLELELGLSP